MLPEIDLLYTLYVATTVGLAPHQPCIDWALARLQRGEEGDSLEVLLLAGATTRDEALPLAQALIRQGLGEGAMDAHVLVGRQLLGLYQGYLRGDVTLETIDRFVTHQHARLAFPRWLGCLCSAAAMGFERPLAETEFVPVLAEVANLWLGVTDRARFTAAFALSQAGRQA